MPQVHEKGAIDVRHDILGRALPEDDLVDSRPLLTVSQVESAVTIGPVEVDRQLHGGERLMHGQSGECVGHRDRAAAPNWVVAEYDSPGDGEVEPGGS